MKKIIIITITILIILFGVFLGITAYLTNGFKETITPDKAPTQNKINSNISLDNLINDPNSRLEENKNYIINCDEKIKDISVLPNGNLFDFKVDNKLYGFGFQDYTKAFNIKINDNKFSFDSSHRPMIQILKEYFNTDKIEVPKNVGNAETIFFILHIETENKSIDFKLKDIGLFEGIYINPDEVNF